MSVAKEHPNGYSSPQLLLLYLQFFLSFYLETTSGGAQGLFLAELGCVSVWECWGLNSVSYMQGKLLTCCIVSGPESGFYHHICYGSCFGPHWVAFRAYSPQSPVCKASSILSPMLPLQPTSRLLKSAYPCCSERALGSSVHQETLRHGWVTQQDHQTPVL